MWDGSKVTEQMTLSRRSLITGLVSFAVTAPAIVRAGSLMPVKVMPTAEELSATLINQLYQNTANYWFAHGNLIHRVYMENDELKREIINNYEFFKDAQWQ